MLRKIILQGLVAAVLVAGASGLYAASAGQMPVLSHHDDHHHGEDE